MIGGFEWGARLPTLEGTRVVLRPLDERDVPELFAIFSDAEVMRYWDSPPMTSVAEASRLLTRIDAGLRGRHLFQWGVTEPPERRLIGTCTLFRVDRSHRRAEIGIAMASHSWGKGLAADALTTLIAFAFDRLNLHRLEADVDPRNVRSLRLLERQDFRREGYLRERYHVSGEPQDSILLGLLRPDWNRRAV